MKKHKLWLLLMFGAALALIPFVGIANAQATRTAFTAMDAECSVTPGTQWISGNVLHIRGEVDTKRIASSDLKVNGSEQAVVNIDLNLATGSGNGWGTVVIRPDTIEGTWTGSFSGPITPNGFAGSGARDKRIALPTWHSPNPNGFAGSGVAQGTGALGGYHLKARFQEIQPPANQPCAPN